MHRLGRSCRVRILDLTQYPLGRLEIGAAGFRQGQAPRRPVQEFDTQPILERRHVLGRHGLRHAERARRRRQAPQSRHAREDLQPSDTIEHKPHLTPRV